MGSKVGFPLPPEHILRCLYEGKDSLFRNKTSLGKDFVEEKVMSFFSPPPHSVSVVLR